MKAKTIKKTYLHHFEVLGGPYPKDAAYTVFRQETALVPCYVVQSKGVEIQRLMKEVSK